MINLLSQNSLIQLVTHFTNKTKTKTKNDKNYFRDIFVSSVIEQKIRQK